MISEKSVLAVVPARGGSKGIPLKNLSKINEKSLIWYVSEVVKKVSDIDQCVVSTDHIKIKEEALRCGLDVPFMRPEEISGDLISDLQVLKHAIHSSENFYKKNFDIVLMIQPTSPLRTFEHVEQCLRQLIDQDADAAWTVSPVDLKFHPLKQLSVSDDHDLIYYSEEGSKVFARQQLKQSYVRNGACYAWKKEFLLGDYDQFLPVKTVPVIIEELMVDIDSIDDLDFCSKILSSR